MIQDPDSVCWGTAFLLAGSFEEQKKELEVILSKYCLPTSFSSLPFEHSHLLSMPGYLRISAQHLKCLYSKH